MILCNKWVFNENRNCESLSDSIRSDFQLLQKTCLYPMSRVQTTSCLSSRDFRATPSCHHVFNEVSMNCYGFENIDKRFLTVE